jgi:hypothetical protein
MKLASPSLPWHLSHDIWRSKHGLKIKPCGLYLWEKAFNAKNRLKFEDVERTFSQTSNVSCMYLKQHSTHQTRIEKNKHTSEDLTTERQLFRGA